MAEEDAAHKKPVASKIVGQLGIGCAQFRPKNDDRKFENVDEFIDELKNSLQNLPAVHDLDVHFENMFHSLEDHFHTPYPSISDHEALLLTGGRGFRLDISMVLRIPEHIQRQILREDDPDWPAYGDLRVRIIHQYHSPLMFVSSINYLTAQPLSDLCGSFYELL